MNTRFVVVVILSVFGASHCKPKGYISNGLSVVNGTFSAGLDFMRREMEPRVKRIEESLSGLGVEMDRRFDDMRESMAGLGGLLQPGNKFPGDIIIQMTPDEGTGDKGSPNNNGGGLLPAGGNLPNPIAGVMQTFGRIPQTIQGGGGDAPNPISGVMQTFANIPQAIPQIFGGVSKRKQLKNGGDNPDVVILEEDKDN